MTDNYYTTSFIGEPIIFTILAVRKQENIRTQVNQR